jgi:hypothetical protein
VELSQLTFLSLLAAVELVAIRQQVVVRVDFSITHHNH